MEPVRVLVADDKENMRKLFAKILADGYDVETAQDGASALALVASRAYDVVVTDIRMPGADGFELLAAVKARAPTTEVVMVTGYATVADAVRAMKQGAFDYLEKPFDPDAALAVVARAAEHKRLVDAARLAAAPGDPDAFHNLVGRSPRMREVYALLDKAAHVDATVLVLGETGTGKELAARAIHYHSGRRERRFMPVNCGALPGELIESELFGHARGAFTGAAVAKPGLFEEARGGTVFLDEVGELPLSAQVKLNRALQEKEIRRVGESTPVKIDVRIVAATHRDLREEVRAGRFREDLFYRLNVIAVTLPPLRDRAEDVPLLAAHFLDKHARALRRELRGFEPEVLVRLAGYAWPGNVRELENTIERAVAVAGGERIGLADLPPEVAAPPAGAAPAEALAALPYRDAVAGARDRVTREYLVALLTEFEGNVTRAAERAGLERESLHRLLRKHGLRSEDFKPA
ncbi:sigma-54 dependent transcriptional regulator [Anaeromyxobacter sp. Fw109-5]|uniref:sigma-54-dependent transcriptional regulator n=1 Tax=Anaeromyxobacter sp. (strain Fw109-5) TaxID=404589 RepID=UPI0000ED6D75|nr:sigma-54 dependent transcriptional regulator [Anaeromyxobacter sp. Fw109-5]ABS28435.1 two component, sigma54 specific, transcriptional regulator, Fis family [Anaeromyxobacter sp. Fw109-5]